MSVAKGGEDEDKDKDEDEDDMVCGVIVLPSSWE